MTRNVTIQITNNTKTKGTSPKLIIAGTVTLMKNVSEHDLVAYLFALEFAANNHSEIPMRVHISYSAE